jgi:hypothetical protein
MAIKSIKLKNPIWRVLLLALPLVALVGVYFFGKWCFANVLASRGNKVLAELMTEWAPSDPQTHLALAVLNQKTFLPDDFDKSLLEYEKATALSPHDFRLWLELGKARERNGDSIEAEKALRKALELAPNYAVVHWTLGNILLRRGETDEAFAEIRTAIEADPRYAAPTISTAWTIFDGDVAQIRRALGDSVSVNSALTLFLVKQKDYDNALAMWNALPEGEKKTNLKKTGEELFGEMTAAKKYRAALQIQKQISEPGAPEAQGFEVGKIFNGGFESNEKTEKKSVFDWQFGEGTPPQIGVDNQQKRGGNLSLVIIFNAPDGKLARTVSQTVVVEPGKRYAFETFYKSNLGKTSTTFKWEIINVADDKVLAVTEAISPNADWTNIRAEFVAPENAEAILVRLARDVCKSTSCPVSGRIWFDDFSLNQ